MSYESAPFFHLRLAVQPLEALGTAIQEWLDAPDVHVALRLASPSLAHACDQADWRWNNLGASQQNSLVRYRARMASRPTPFGLFAGCGIGRIEDRLDLRLPDVGDWYSISRLDMGDAFELEDKLGDREVVNRRAKLRLNQSAWRVGERLHYVARIREADRIDYDFQAADLDEPLSAVWRLFNETPILPISIAIETLRDLLPESAAEEVMSYIEQLVEGQVLELAQGLRCTGDDPMEDLFKYVEGLGSIRRQGRVHSTSQALCPDHTFAPPSADVTMNDEVQVQTDLFFSADHLEIPSIIPEEVLVGVRGLARVGAHFRTGLEDFRERFHDRFGTARVPLGLALDPELGIRFEHEDRPKPLEASPDLNDLLADLVGRSDPFSGRTVRIGEREIKRFSETDRDIDLGEGFAVLGRLSARSKSEIEAGRFSFLLQRIQGPSCGALLGRFAHGDEKLRSALKSALKREGDVRNETLAEIVHLPTGRVGNITFRPVLRDAEIAYLGRGSGRRQLHVRDLEVSYSPGPRRFTLWVGSTNERIVPRLASAHNFSHPKSLPIYRFLSLLQLQDTAIFVWDWREWRMQRFLPRVVYGKTVWSLATWLVTKREVQLLGERAEQGTARAVRELKSWRESLGLPQQVLVGESDRVWALNIEDPKAVRALVDEFKGERFVRLREYYPDLSSEPVVDAGERHHASELVLPFVRVERRQNGAESLKSLTTTWRGVRLRTRLDGWTYLKVYTGRGYFDRLLASHIAPALDELQEGGLVKGWFFIRYADPYPHLRVRWRVSTGAVRGDTEDQLYRVLEPNVRHGIVWRIQQEPYVRELERYGGERGIELAEHAFEIDTQVAIGMIRDAPGPANREIRRRHALRCVYGYLHAWGLDDHEKAQILRSGEYPAKATREKWGQMARADREWAYQCWNEDGFGIGELWPAFNATVARFAKALDNLHSGAQRDALFGLTHMHLNRCLSLGYPDEPYLYELLYRMLTAAAHVRASRQQ